MTTFVVVGCLLVAAALLFVLPPLWNRQSPRSSGIEVPAANALVLREQLNELDRQLIEGQIAPAEHAEASAEIRRRVLEGADSPAAPLPRAPWRARPLAAGLAVAVPAAVIGLYLWLGDPAGLDPAKVAPAAGGNHALTREQVAAMVERLATRLRSQPDDFDGWVMLARSRSALGEYGPSAQAWGRAAALRPSDASLLAEQADALAMARGRRLAGEPEALVLKALAVDGNHPKTLALAGSVAFEKGDYRQAIVHWRKLAEVAPPGSDFARSIQGSIEDAERRLQGGAGGVAAGAGGPAGGTAAAAGGGQALPAGTAPRADASAASAGALSGTVEIAPELAASVRAGDTLFVIARPADGGRVPIAVSKVPVGAFPMRFRLDDSHAMNPAQRLSQAGSVVLVARISRAGAPIGQSGDLEGASAPLAIGTGGVALRIDRRLP